MNKHIVGSLLLSGLALALAPIAPAQAADKPVPYTETIPGTVVTFEMLPIPGGKTELPDPAKPGQTRQVDIKPCWMGKTEVTWDEFDIYAFRLDLTQEEKAAGVDAQARPSAPYGVPDRGFGHQGYGALAMSRHSAELYCKWLSKKTGKKYRLPTEAEWEWACRAGEAKPPVLDKDALDKVAWYWDNAEDKTHPVASKQPNAWGLYDMLGNLAEWCGDERVVRGGHYNAQAKDVSCAARLVETPAWDDLDPQNPKSIWWLSDGPFVGFRVVRDE